MINFEDIKKAEATLNGVVFKTPLLHSYFLSNGDCDVYLKLENLQRTGSFKMRGAFNKIANLTEEERKKGVIAASAGNHAQGVALSANLFGIPSVICMPATAPLAKVNNTKAFGAEVILNGIVYDDAYAKAVEVQKERGMTFIHPFDDDYVMAGQGTIGLEILNEIEDLDAIVVPIGGGGIIAGIAVAAKAINPKIKIYGVHPEVITSMKSSLAENKVVTYTPKAPTIADGIAVKKCGDRPFEVAQKYVDEIVTVSENDIYQAILFLIEKNRVVAEGAGAVAVAAMLGGKIKGHKKVALIVSGGNIDVTVMEKIIDKGLMSMGRMYDFSVNIVEKSDDRTRLFGLLAESNAHVIEASMGRMSSHTLLNHQQLDLVIETYGHDHLEIIMNKLKEAGFNPRH